MRQCAYLTLDQPIGYFIDDELTYEPLRKLGWHVRAVPWRDPHVDWSAYEAVVIRSPWDYTEALEPFLEAVERIDRSGTKLFNSLDIVRWNARKTYLQDLAQRGVPIIPTVWHDRLVPGELSKLFASVDAPEGIIKPVVGANARGTWRLDKDVLHEKTPEIEAYYANGPFMMQPFVPAIVNEGEFSLTYFNGELSHTILKTPKTHDFRVQEEHGGILKRIEPEPELKAAGDRALRAVGESLLYARADFVRAPKGQGFWLMELELIEPSLYFRMDEQAADRFAHALNARFS